MVLPKSAFFGVSATCAAIAVTGCSLLLSNGDFSEEETTPPEASTDAASLVDDATVTDSAGPSDVDAATKSSLYRAAVLQDEPIAYYRFAETSGTTAKDERGAYAGTYIGQVLFGQEGPYAGSSAVRLGQGNFVDVSSLIAHSAWPGITLEGWFLSDVDVLEFLIAFHRADGANLNHVVRHTGGAPEYGDTIVYGSAPAHCDIAKWCHVVASIDATNAGKLYVDGVEQGSFTTTVRPATVGLASIGVDHDPDGDGGTKRNNYLVGRVAEVAIYDKGLSAERVAAHYQAAQ